MRTYIYEIAGIHAVVVSPNSVAAWKKVRAKYQASPRLLWSTDLPTDEAEVICQIATTPQGVSIS